MPSSSYKAPREYGLRAKQLRKEAPVTERLLWKALSELRKQTGLHFRRQHPVPPYFADFACIKALLIIEIDGESHNSRQNYDAKRDMELRHQGWEVMRFMNEDVSSNLEGVVVTITDRAQQRLRLAHPQPLPQAGGEQLA